MEIWVLLTHMLGYRKERFDTEVSNIDLFAPVPGMLFASTKNPAPPVITFPFPVPLGWKY